jgi:glycosyltransferase involved in cell wall biosynthesis
MKTKGMRILHAPQNIGGMAGVMAKAQRELGVDAQSYSFSNGVFQYVSDHELSRRGPLARQVQALWFAAKFSLTFDVFHLYFGESLLGPSLADVPWLRRLGKKVFFHFCGCDIRDSKKTVARHEISACHECWPMLCSPNHKEAQRVAREQADGVFVSTPDLLEFVESAQLLPQPIDLEQFSCARSKLLVATAPRASDRVRIVHAPTNRLIKGTRYIEKAVEKLAADGLDIELVLVEGRPYEEALQIYSEADIGVDQVLIGAYGQFSIEMMALRKPVVCFIRDDLRKYTPPSLPIISATPKDLIEVLREVMRDREHWKALGEAGRTYVEQVHDVRRVAAKALAAYSK